MAPKINREKARLLVTSLNGNCWLLFCCPQSVFSAITILRQRGIALFWVHSSGRCYKAFSLGTLNLKMTVLFEQKFLKIIF